MKCVYWEAPDRSVIRILKSYEKSLENFAHELWVDTDNLVIDYNRNSNVFKKWYDGNSIGVVEEGANKIRVIINMAVVGNAVNEGVTSMMGPDEAQEYLAKTCALVAATIISEHAVEYSETFQKIIARYDEELYMPAHMYIAARVRMQYPNIKKFVTVVNDPYMYATLPEMSEIDWRNLFNSVAYITEAHDSKNFWKAIVSKHQGKALEAPNALDLMISKLEAIYDTYIEQTVK